MWFLSRAMNGTALKSMATREQPNWPNEVQLGTRGHRGAAISRHPLFERHSGCEAIALRAGREREIAQLALDIGGIARLGRKRLAAMRSTDCQPCPIPCGRSRRTARPLQAATRQSSTPSLVPDTNAIAESRRQWVDADRYHLHPTEMQSESVSCFPDGVSKRMVHADTACLNKFTEIRSSPSVCAAEY